MRGAGIGRRPVPDPLVARGDVNHGGLHEGDHLEVVGVSRRVGPDFARADGQRATGVLDPADSHETLPERGTQEIRLELGGHDVVPLGRTGQAGIPAGGVDQAGDGTGVELAQLLRQARGKRHGDVHFAILHPQQLGAQRGRLRWNTDSRKE